MPRDRSKVGQAAQGANALTADRLTTRLQVYDK